MLSNVIQCLIQYLRGLMAPSPRVAGAVGSECRPLLVLLIDLLCSRYKMGL